MHHRAKFGEDRSNRSGDMAEDPGRPLEDPARPPEYPRNTPEPAYKRGASNAVQSVCSQSVETLSSLSRDAVA